MNTGHLWALTGAEPFIELWNIIAQEALPSPSRHKRFKEVGLASYMLQERALSHGAD